MTRFVAVITVLAMAPLLKGVIGDLKAMVPCRRGPRRSKATTSPNSCRHRGRSPKTLQSSSGRRRMAPSQWAAASRLRPRQRRGSPPAIGHNREAEGQGLATRDPSGAGLSGLPRRRRCRATLDALVPARELRGSADAQGPPHEADLLASYPADACPGERSSQAHFRVLGQVAPPPVSRHPSEAATFSAPRAVQYARSRQTPA